MSMSAGPVDAVVLLGPPFQRASKRDGSRRSNVYNVTRDSSLRSGKNTSQSGQNLPKYCRPWRRDPKRIGNGY